VIALPRFNQQVIYGLVEDAEALSGVAGALVQIGANILNDKVRRVYKIIVTDVLAAGGILTIWQGDAVVPNRTRLMDIVVPAGVSLEFGLKIDDPLITARPTTSAAPVQNNQLYLEDNVAGGEFRVSFSQYDMRG
jgi:hypothetical protein